MSRSPRVVALLLGQLAALAAMSACAPAASTLSAEEARTRFSDEAYCPLSRVTAQPRGAVPPAPSSIARDPERIAMWHQAHERRAPARQTIDVTGCGERREYACWTLSGLRPTRHGYSRIAIGAACVEQ
jgi:hypothetical protein